MVSGKGMPDDLIAPTPERFQHGQLEVEGGHFKSIELLEKTIADDEGRPSQPLRSIDILSALERREAITPEMREAGEWFGKRYRASGLDPLKAADMSRPIVSGKIPSAPSWRAENAGNDVWRALLWVGGRGSPAGSCLEHVVGWEISLKQWAQEHGWQAKTATGILIAALGTLAAHYGNNRR